MNAVPGNQFLSVWLSPLVAALVLSSCTTMRDPVPPPQEQLRSVEPITLIGRRISVVSIRYEGAKTVEEERLFRSIHVREDSIHSEQAMDDSLKDLYESGLVDDARFEHMADGDKVRVTVVVQTRPGLGPSLHLVGNSIFSDSKLTKHGTACCGKNDMMGKECLEQASRRIESFYRRQGYPSTRVGIPRDHPWVRTDPGDPDSYEACVILIEEGPWTMTGRTFSPGRMRRGR